MARLLIVSLLTRRKIECIPLRDKGWLLDQRTLVPPACFHRLCASHLGPIFQRPEEGGLGSQLLPSTGRPMRRAPIPDSCANVLNGMTSFGSLLCSKCQLQRMEIAHRMVCISRARGQRVETRVGQIILPSPNGRSRLSLHLRQESYIVRRDLRRRAADQSGEGQKVGPDDEIHRHDALDAQVIARASVPCHNLISATMQSTRSAAQSLVLSVGGAEVKECQDEKPIQTNSTDITSSPALRGGGGGLGFVHRGWESAPE